MDENTDNSASVDNEAGNSDVEEEDHATKEQALRQAREDCLSEEERKVRACID